MELIDIFSENEEKMGTIPKKEYYSLKEEAPWIRCCTCFVVDKKSKKILFEKRGNSLLDTGKLDLCSGHVQSNEIPQIAMIRELGEELGIKVETAANIHKLGQMNFDYTKLSDETNRKNLKCFVSIYALMLDDLSQINIDNNEVVRYGWLSYNDAKGFIENSMTRIPYEDYMRQNFNKIFENLHSYMTKTNSREQDIK